MSKDDQLPLIGPRGGLRPRPRRSQGGPAEAGGVSVEVLVDSRLPHLARAFTYTVPSRWARDAVAGCRVRVRIGAQRHDGFVIGPGRVGFDGPIRPIDALVSPVPVLTPAVLELCRQVAAHYAGTVPDVVRLAVPPRVAAVEEGWRPRTVSVPVPGATPVGPTLDAVAVDALRAPGSATTGESTPAPRTPGRWTWPVPAGVDWPGEIAALAASVLAERRGVLIVVPDRRELDRLEAAVRRVVPADAFATMTADQGPRQRYEAFLRVRSGAARLVIGTRAAAFAPVADLSLLVLWDDGDPALAELRAPYPHAREVLALRSHLAGATLLVAGHARTCEVQRWLDAGWLAEVDDASRTRARRPRAFAAADRVRSPFDGGRRFPEAAVAALRLGLADGPVLVQVARRGYVPVTACQQCREPAECPACGGPLGLDRDGGVACRRCGRELVFACPTCGGEQLRAVRTGARRIADEVGRLFPQASVVVSSGDHRIATLADDPLIVIATPGVEPLPASGYAAAAVVDAQEDLWRVGVRAREEALRRWLNAAALLRPGAPLAVNADPDDPATQALIRWDPALSAREELARRAEAGLPPAHQLVQLDGAEPDVESLIETVAEMHDVTVLGPRPMPVEAAPDAVRALLRAADFPALLATLHDTVVARAATHRAGPVRVQVDPPVLD